MHLIDNETKVDLLNNEPIAATVVKLLRESAGTAITVGLHGDWGAGEIESARHDRGGLRR